MGRVGDFAGSYSATINNIKYEAKQDPTRKYWAIGVPFIATQDTDDVWSSSSRECNFSTVFKVKKGQTYYFYADLTEQLYVWNTDPWAVKRGAWCDPYEFAGNSGKYWGEPCVAPYLIGTEQVADISVSNANVAYVTRPQDSSKSPFPMGLYEVYFNSNTSDVVTNMPSTQTKKHDVDLELNFTPVRAGYKFLGWTQSSIGNIYASKYSDNKSTTFYAQWKIIPPPVSYVYFNSNTDDPVTNMPNTITKTHNVDLELNFTPYRFGYTFLGWTQFPIDDVYVSKYTGNKDTTFYAQWKVIKYDVTYNINLPVEFKDKITATISTRNATKYHGKDYVVSSTAKIYNLTESVTINYSNNQKWVNSSTKFTDTFTHKFSFLGWNTSADGSGTTYQNGDIITDNKNIVLYAQWHPYRDSDTFTVNKLSKVGQTKDKVYTDNYSYFARFYPRTPNQNTRIFKSVQCVVKETWQFVGWNTKENGTGTYYYEGTSYPIDTWLNVNALYGQWKLINSEYLPVTVSQPTCDGFTFLGWMHDSDEVETSTQISAVTNKDYFGTWRVNLTDYSLRVMYKSIASQLYSWHNILYRLYDRKNSLGIPVVADSEFRSDKTYSKDAIIRYKNVLYIAKSNITAGEFKSSEWTALAPHKNEKITKNHINNIITAIKYLFNNCNWYKNSGVDFSYFIKMSPITSITKLSAEIKDKLNALLIEADAYLTLKEG